MPSDNARTSTYGTCSQSVSRGSCIVRFSVSLGDSGYFPTSRPVCTRNCLSLPGTTSWTTSSEQTPAPPALAAPEPSPVQCAPTSTPPFQTGHAPSPALDSSHVSGRVSDSTHEDAASTSATARTTGETQPPHTKESEEPEKRQAAKKQAEEDEVSKIRATMRRRTDFDTDRFYAKLKTARMCLAAKLKTADHDGGSAMESLQGRASDGILS